MIKVTREGKRFLLAVFIVGFAASNTGNNLIYLIFSMMFSVFLLSLFLPNINLTGLRLALDIQEPVFATTPVTLKTKIINRKRFISSLSFRLNLPVNGTEGIYIERIGPGETREYTLRLNFPRRGMYDLADTTIRSEFPFIFFSFVRRAVVERRILVYPRIYDVSGEAAGFVADVSGPFRPRPGPGEDLFKLRPFRYGDELRSIHWKATARAGEVVVKEFSMSEPEKVTVFLDDLRHCGEEQFEKAVSFTASIAAELLNSGFAVRLVTSRKTIPFGTGRGHLYRILDFLALLEQHDEPAPTFDGTAEGSGILVLSSRSSPMAMLAPLADRTYHAEDL